MATGHLLIWIPSSRWCTDCIRTATVVWQPREERGSTSVRVNIYRWKQGGGKPVHWSLSVFSHLLKKVMLLSQLCGGKNKVIESQIDLGSHSAYPQLCDSGQVTSLEHQSSHLQNGDKHSVLFSGWAKVRDSYHIVSSLLVPTQINTLLSPGNAEGSRQGPTLAEAEGGEGKTIISWGDKCFKKREQTKSTLFSENDLTL